MWSKSRKPRRVERGENKLHVLKNSHHNNQASDVWTPKMQGQYNMRSPAVKRLMKEAQELKDPTELYYAQPLEDNLFEWHFTLRGPEDSEFDGGIYHGRIVLPPEYPMKPPSIILLTPNGRFEIFKKICLSISGHHPESWQPSWSIRTALLAIIGFMPTHGGGAIGSLDYTPEERKVLAKKSQDWKCPDCGDVSKQLKPKTEASDKAAQEAKELATQINFQGEKSASSQTKTSEEVATAAPTTAPSASSPPSQAPTPTPPIPPFPYGWGMPPGWGTFPPAAGGPTTVPRFPYPPPFMMPPPSGLAMPPPPAGSGQAVPFYPPLPFFPPMYRGPSPFPGQGVAPGVSAGQASTPQASSDQPVASASSPQTNQTQPVSNTPQPTAASAAGTSTTSTALTRTTSSTTPTSTSTETRTTLNTPATSTSTETIGAMSTVSSTASSATASTAVTSSATTTATAPSSAPTTTTTTTAATQLRQRATQSQTPATTTTPATASSNPAAGVHQSYSLGTMVMMVILSLAITLLIGRRIYLHYFAKDFSGV